MPKVPARTGFTLFELVIVLAMLIILAAATLPSFSAIRGNTDQKAGADVLRARIADARGLAMQEGSAYRLAVHQDGTRIRLAPDVAEFANVPASSVASAGVKALEVQLEKVTINVAADSESGGPAAADQDSWVTIGTFLPNGTCREIHTVIEVHEADFPPIKILLRGVTGTARILQNDPGTNGGKK
jgi:type II secretory pathway pseudopilin PulG